MNDSNIEFDLRGGSDAWVYTYAQIIDLPAYLHPLLFPFDLCKPHWSFIIIQEKKSYKVIYKLELLGKMEICW